MKITDIVIQESYKDARRVFINTVESKDVVDEYIGTFKELSNKNMIEKNDISYWIKQGWNAFSKYVDDNKNTMSVRQKRIQDKSKKIVLYNQDNILAVAPLNHSASKYYGKGTKWCTSSNTSNDWDEYFKTDKFVLVYVLKSECKYAIRFGVFGTTLYDSTDEEITSTEFVNNIGVSPDIFIDLANEHIDTIRYHQSLE